MSPDFEVFTGRLIAVYNKGSGEVHKSQKTNVCFIQTIALHCYKTHCNKCLLCNNTTLCNKRSLKCNNVLQNLILIQNAYKTLPHFDAAFNV